MGKDLLSAVPSLVFISMMASGEAALAAARKKRISKRKEQKLIRQPAEEAG
jgi:hypothetical protein